MKIIIWFWPWRWTKKVILLEDEERKVTCMLICIALRGSESLQNISLARFELCKIHIMSHRNTWAGGQKGILGIFFESLSIFWILYKKMFTNLERKEKNKKTKFWIWWTYFEIDEQILNVVKCFWNRNRCWIFFENRWTN